MQENVNISDSTAGAIGLGGSFIASLLRIINIETVVDALVVTVITLVVSFYGNRLLKWIHREKKKKDTEA